VFFYFALFILISRSGIFVPPVISGFHLKAGAADHNAPAPADLISAHIHG